MNEAKLARVDRFRKLVTQEAPLHGLSSCPRVSTHTSCQASSNSCLSRELWEAPNRKTIVVQCRQSTDAWALTLRPRSKTCIRWPTLIELQTRLKLLQSPPQEVIVRPQALKKLTHRLQPTLARNLSTSSCSNRSIVTTFNRSTSLYLWRRKSHPSPRQIWSQPR